MIVPHRKRDVLVLAAACVAVAVGARSFAAGQATTTLTLAVKGGTVYRAEELLRTEPATH